MNKLFLCSFASPDLKRSVIRFENQAKNMKIYEKIKVFGYNDLSADKKNQINNFFKIKQKRLYGYGSWKAFIIRTFLDQVPENSILQYSDIGCHLNLRGITRLKEYVQLCNEKSILTFQYKKPDFKNFYKFNFQEYYEYQYTKGDVWRFLKIDDNSEILKSNQLWSGTIFFKNDRYSKEILNEWSEFLNISSLIDDSASLSQNHKDFVEHRHDQSLFSLICKKRNVHSLSASECEWAEINKSRTWEHAINFPIHAKRDKKYNFLKRFLNRQKKNFKRIFNNAKN